MKPVEGVWGQYKGLNAEEIREGLNTGKSPLRLYAEKRGLNHGKVVKYKHALEAVRMARKEGYEQAQGDYDIVTEKDPAYKELNKIFVKKKVVN